jgi:hypothetical protein
MTNRPDLLDEALTRPGRIELKIEIGLPDEEGRLQILKIHTGPLSKNGFLAQDVSLPELAERTKNFTGVLCFRVIVQFCNEHAHGEHLHADEHAHAFNCAGRPRGMAFPRLLGMCGARAWLPVLLCQKRWVWACMCLAATRCMRRCAARAGSVCIGTAAVKS